MKHLRAALARLAGVFTGHRADDDLRSELQAHLDMETAENIRRGMRPDEARRRATLGIGGVLAFSVSARTNEIGIRMSLGADSGRVQGMILGEGGVLLAGGLVLGVAGAYVASGVIRGCSSVWYRTIPSHSSAWWR
jgi:hypothetical protein